MPLHPVYRPCEWENPCEQPQPGFRLRQVQSIRKSVSTGKNKGFSGSNVPPVTTRLRNNTLFHQKFHGLERKRCQKPPPPPPPPPPPEKPPPPPPELDPGGTEEEETAELNEEDRDEANPAAPSVLQLAVPLYQPGR